MAADFASTSTWGVTDAILHVLAMNEAYRSFEEIRQHELGYMSTMLFSTASMKALALFASLRQNSMILATVITSSLGFLSAYAMSSFAGSLAGTLGHGAAAGAAVSTPEGMSTKRRELEDTPTMLTTASLLDHKDRVASRVNQAMRGYSGGMRMGNPESAVNLGRDEMDITMGGVSGKKMAAGEKGLHQASLQQNYTRETAGLAYADRDQKFADDNKMSLSNMYMQQPVSTVNSNNEIITSTASGGYKQTKGAGYSYTDQNGTLSSSFDNYTPILEVSKSDQLIRGGVEKLATNTKFTEALKSGRSVSEEFGVSEAGSRKIHEVWQHTLRDQVLSNKNGFTYTGTDEEKETFFASLKLGSPLKILGGEAGARLETIAKDGKTVSIGVDSNDQTRFAHSTNEALERAVVKTANTKEGLNYMKEISKAVDATSAYESFTQASTNEAIMSKQSHNLSPIIHENVRKSMFDDLPVDEGRSKAAQTIAGWAASGSTEDKRKLDSEFIKASENIYKTFKPDDSVKTAANNAGDLMTRVEDAAAQTKILTEKMKLNQAIDIDGTVSPTV
jgi:hypothetical protein